MFSAKDIFLTKAKSGYTIAKSLRFRSSASAYLSRTPGSAGNRKTFTISYWMKRGTLGSATYLFAAGSGTTEATWFANAIDTATASDQIGSASWTTTGGYTNASLRDPSAWYHIVLAIDTTQATAANRSKLYINGVLQTYTGAVSLSLNADLAWNNSGVVHYIGARIDSGPRMFFDGYFADVYNIDGQALDPTYFGQTDTATGVWMPKAYTGSYGTNGFYLKFSDASAATAAAIGKDSSPNGNNWTPNNISVTAGVTYDSMYDTPTNYDNGVTGAGNYCVLNPLDKNTITVSDANLSASYGSAAWYMVRGTVAISTGKWYWEVTATSASSHCVGIATASASLAGVCGGDANGWGYWQAGYKYNSGSAVAYGATWTTNDVIGIAFDADAGTLTFYKNNTSQGTAYSGLSANVYFPAVSENAGSSAINFGQRPFTYTPPSGFKALNTQNLPTPTIGATSSTLANKYMDVSLYTGNGSTQSVNNAGSFQPDFVWIKNRSNAASHSLFDAVRGATKSLISNLTDAEYTATDSLTAFNSGGFALGANTVGGANVNVNTQTYVGWQWKANGSGSSNTSGTITSTVSANVTSGFSVVTYTGTGANATVGHGLGVAPKMVIVKKRTGTIGSGTSDWMVYHSSLANTQVMYLNATAAVSTAANMWNSTSPTSTVFSLGNNSEVNESTSTLVAYCFAEVAGYSKFGSYTGNGSTDGPFVYCGFRPKYVLIKRTDVANSWAIADTSRSPSNVVAQDLYAEQSAAEGTSTSIDILSNGFKVRTTAAYPNASGGTYIYAAFAESPFNYARAR